MLYGGPGNCKINLDDKEIKTCLSEDFKYFRKPNDHALSAINKLLKEWDIAEKILFNGDSI